MPCSSAAPATLRWSRSSGARRHGGRDHLPRAERHQARARARRSPARLHVLAMGVGAFSAGIFHLYTHAFFKACLFPDPAPVIHALHGERASGHGRAEEGAADYLPRSSRHACDRRFPLLSGFSQRTRFWEDVQSGFAIPSGRSGRHGILTATYVPVFLTFWGDERGRAGGASARSAWTRRTWEGTPARRAADIASR